MSIPTNRDFLFLFEAKHTNPNGDPDNENKPRMDADTQTNLVSDVRLKRYVRDYFKQQGQEIFVDMVGNSKVTMQDRLTHALRERLGDADKMRQLLTDDDSHQLYVDQLEQHGGNVDKLIDTMVAKKTKVKDLNQAVLSALVQEDFIDVRLFGSAFAIDGFNRAVTGPVQLAWGYSLNKVFLLESNTISSIMNDDSSTFGRDHRLKYSLLAFQGTINAAAARHTGLTEADLDKFRAALWAGVSANPTRSKMNQYPLLYVEFEYKEGTPNGSLGDLRRYINCTVSDGLTDKQVDDLDDLKLDFSRLYELRESGDVKATVEMAANRLDFTAKPEA